MSDDNKWTPGSAYMAVKSMVAQDADLMQAILSGVTDGFKAREDKLRNEMVWTNMALDMALTLATKKFSGGTKKLAEDVIRKRLEAWGANYLNGAEKAFLTSLMEREDTQP